MKPTFLYFSKKAQLFEDSIVHHFFRALGDFHGRKETCLQSKLLKLLLICVRMHVEHLYIATHKISGYFTCQNIGIGKRASHLHEHGNRFDYCPYCLVLKTYCLSMDQYSTKVPSSIITRLRKRWISSGLRGLRDSPLSNFTWTECVTDMNTWNVVWTNLFLNYSTSQELVSFGLKRLISQKLNS